MDINSTYNSAGSFGFPASVNLECYESLSMAKITPQDTARFEKKKRCRTCDPLFHEESVSIDEKEKQRLLYNRVRSVTYRSRKAEERKKIKDENLSLRKAFNELNSKTLSLKKSFFELSIKALSLKKAFDELDSENSSLGKKINELNSENSSLSKEVQQLRVLHQLEELDYSLKNEWLQEFELVDERILANGQGCEILNSWENSYA